MKYFKVKQFIIHGAVFIDINMWEYFFQLLLQHNINSFINNLEDASLTVIIKFDCKILC